MRTDAMLNKREVGQYKLSVIAFPNTKAIIRLWCNDSMWVSKTLGLGSNPRGRAKAYTATFKW